MCVKLRKMRMPNGLTVEVPCRKCWSCRENRARDWAGRCIAESMHAGRSLFWTGTYGDSAKYDVVPNEFAAFTVVPRHVQLWLKRIRKAGHKVRFLITSEFGPLKGRVHWHAALFFEGNGPDVPLGERLASDPFWPHGFTYWEEFTPATAFYVVKYLQKAEREDNKLLKHQVVDQYEVENFNWVSLSRKPVLGARYFEERAAIYVKQGLAPQDLFYSFPEVKDKQGKVRRFYLKKGSASADYFLKSFVDQWAAKHGRHPPTSEVLSDYFDRVAPAPSVLAPAAAVVRVEVPSLPVEGRDLRFIDRLNAWACTVGPADAPERLLWSFDANGHPAWQDRIVAPSEAAKRREVASAKPLPEIEGQPVPARPKFRVSGLPEWNGKPFRLEDAPTEAERALVEKGKGNERS